MPLLGPWLVYLTSTVAVIAAAIYYFITTKFDYWKTRNIPYIQPSFPFGNFGKLYRKKITFSEAFEEFYREFKTNGFGGVFNFRQPVFVVCDPELIKNVLTKDFGSFHDRGFVVDEDNDPFSANLFNLEGVRWKMLRAKLSPTFTSGKIKGMFPLILECCDQLNECIQERIKTNSSVEMQDLVIRFTTNVIGSCAFGMNCNSLKNPNSEFYKKTRDFFKHVESFQAFAKFLLQNTFPNFARKVKIGSVFGKFTKFFTEFMDSIVSHRRREKMERNDFVQLMMKVMDEDTDDMTFDLKLMTAQAFLFFVAGLDNVANTIGFSLHAMAIDPELQERVRAEIVEVVGGNEGQISYEALGHMGLVAGVIDETLRKYSPSPVLIRVQNEEKYKIPNTDIEIEKGTQIIIPIQGLHNDEEFFPNPEKFDPDRFTEEEKSSRHPYTYIPFGEGPRFCIASRFAKLEMRLCFAQLIRHFRFSIAPETDVKMEIDKSGLSVAPKNKFWLKVTERRTP